MEMSDTGSTNLFATFFIIDMSNFADMLHLKSFWESKICFRSKSKLILRSVVSVWFKRTETWQRLCSCIAYPFESVDVGGLVLPCQATLVAFSISSDVLLVPLAQLLDSFLDHLISPIVSHRLRTGILSNTCHASRKQENISQESPHVK